jgi:hypothetical protein
MAFLKSLMAYSRFVKGYSRFIKGYSKSHVNYLKSTKACSFMGYASAYVLYLNKVTTSITVTFKTIKYNRYQ